MNKFAFPGDVVEAEFYGPGLIKTQGKVVAVKAGVCRTNNKGTWIDSNQKRYIPSLGDPVIGVITIRHSEGYKVDVGGPQEAFLPALAFEGATKRNRPHLEVGQVVYGRISLANKAMEPEMECIHPSGKSNGYGLLKEGFVTQVSLAFARSLMGHSKVLVGCASLYKFSIAIGMNGSVWISASPQDTIQMVNLLEQADGLDPSKLSALIEYYKRKQVS